MRRKAEKKAICLPYGRVARECNLADRSKLSVGAVRKRRRLRRAVGLMAASAALAANTPPSSGLEGFGRRVADAELGEMRGKFITPNTISHFGITMATDWQDSNGVTTSAVLIFSVDFISPGDFAEATPTVAVHWTRDCAGCADPAMDVASTSSAAGPSQVVAVGSLGSVDGVLQTQQIAGSDNRVVNGMRISVAPEGAESSAETLGLKEISQSEHQQFADGSELTFLVEDNGIGLSMADASGSSVVRQGVSGAMHRTVQSVLLNSNRNRISNDMSIAIGTSGFASDNSVQVQNTIATLSQL